MTAVYATKLLKQHKVISAKSTESISSISNAHETDKNQRSQCFHFPQHASTTQTDTLTPRRDEHAQLPLKQERPEKLDNARPFNEWMNLFSSCCVGRKNAYIFSFGWDMDIRSSNLWQNPRQRLFKWDGLIM